MAKVPYYAAVKRWSWIDVRLAKPDGSYGPIMASYKDTKRGREDALEDCGRRNAEIQRQLSARAQRIAREDGDCDCRSGAVCAACTAAAR